MLTPGQVHFWPQGGMICTNLVEIHQLMLHTNIMALGIVVSDKKIFFGFHLENLLLPCVT